MIKREKEPLFKIMFFDGYEYYFEYNIEADMLKLKGMNIKDFKYKTGSLCLKILSNINQIIKEVDECQAQIYEANDNMELIGKAIFNLEKKLDMVDKIFSRNSTREFFDNIGDRNTKIKELERELGIVERFLKEDKDDEMVIHECNQIKKELKDLTKIKDTEFVNSILDKYIYSINHARLFIDYYYNLITNSEVQETMRNKSPNVRAYSLQAMSNFDFNIPSSEKVLCIIDNDELISANAYLFHKSNKLKLKNKDEMKEYFEVEDMVYGNNCKKTSVYYADIYNVYSINDLLYASINYLIQNKITVSKCKNCSNYFIPSNKNNETLCDNIFKNRKNM